MRAALMLGAHPPGRGSGTGLRALVSLQALRTCFDRVDVVALASVGEEAMADASARLVPRPSEPWLVSRVAALRYGSAYYAAERRARLSGRLRDLIAAGELDANYDLVWACQSLTARAAFEVFHAHARLLDIDNVAAAERRRSAAAPSASRPKRLFRRVSAAALAREERRRCNMMELVTVPSELEQERLGPVRVPVRIVPNTIGPAKRIRPGVTRQRLLFVGSLDYEPNVDAVRWLAGEILPRIRSATPGVVLTVAGRNPSRELRELARGTGIDLQANSPSLDRFYDSARVVVAPLRLGGGTRFKILEAMARGAAIVATQTAAEGLLVEDGRDVQLADDAAMFAARCVALLRDPHSAARLGSAVHERWREHYRTDIAVDRIVSLVHRLVSLGPDPGPR